MGINLINIIIKYSITIVLAMLCVVVIFFVPAIFINSFLGIFVAIIIMVIIIAIRFWLVNLLCD